MAKYYGNKQGVKVVYDGFSNKGTMKNSPYPTDNKEYKGCEMQFEGAGMNEQIHVNGWILKRCK